jgi:outer membrane lipoprotein carrier protein
MLLLPVMAPADATLDSLMGKLQHRYQGMETMKADFSQTYHSKRFSDAISESGTVYFMRGGFMRWEYRKPEEKVFVSDGDFYFYYVPKDNQVIKAPVAKADQHSPALFLAGRGDFVRDFHAEWSDPRPGSHRVKLTPLQAQSDFSYLIVDIDPVEGAILQLDVVDEYDNRTEYDFRSIQNNVKISPDLFVLHTPPGTEVIFQPQESE